MNRVSIYAALQVPEIWRFDGTKLRFHVLQEDGKYRDAEKSLAFPFVKPEHLHPFLEMDADTDETTRIRAFVNWLRDHDIAR